MKKLLFTLIGLLTLSFLIAQPQNQLTIQGQVTDDSTGAPIPNYSVLITSDTAGNGGPMQGYFAVVMTDNNGNYSKVIPLNQVNSPTLFVITMDCQMLPLISVVQVNPGVQTVDFSICFANMPPPPNCIADFTANPIGPNNMFKWKFFSNSMPQNAQHSWDFGDGTASMQNSPMHTYSAPGMYNVCLTITDPGSNCTDSYCMNILVDSTNVPPPPQCNADFIAFPGGQNPANMYSWHFHSLSVPPNATHSWDFGDGATSNMFNPTHTYAQPGLYNVCLTIYDSVHICADTFCLPVLVDSITPPPLCQADFDAWPMPNDPAQWKFMSMSLPPFASHNWDFGDGTASMQKNPMHTYSSPGMYNVCLTITDSISGCTDSYCMNILVDSTGGNLNCFADFIAWPMNFMNTDKWKFQSLSIPMNAAHSWDFGDGNTSTMKNPVHTYANPGIYNVCLTITDSAGSCTDTWCMDVIVDSINTPPACLADFDAWPLPNGSGDWKFLSLTTPPFADHYWDFGDGNTSTMKNPMHTYANPGMYTVCLTISDSLGGCNDSYCLSILVDTMPGGPAGPGGGMMCDADFTFTIDSNGTTVHFLDQSMPVPDFWMWDFGDGNSSTAQNPVHTYTATGTYQVSLVIGFLNCICFDTASMTVGSPISIAITGEEEIPAQEIAGQPYPNPVDGVLNLDLNLQEPQEAIILLTDITGKVVWSEARRLAEGAQTLRMSTDSFGQGIYLLSIELEGGQRIVRKISK